MVLGNIHMIVDVISHIDIQWILHIHLHLVVEAPFSVELFIIDLQVLLANIPKAFMS